MNKERLKWFSGKMPKKEEQEYFYQIGCSYTERVRKEIEEERKINEFQVV